MLSNSTLSSSPDEYGYRYWCSFCGKPFQKGWRLNAYHGILNGHGPQFGNRHVVKIFRNKRGSERLCDIEIKKTQKARQLSRRFAVQHDVKKAINFMPLLKAHMDETPFFRCSSDWKRPLRRDEWVLIEERTGKKFKTFSYDDGVQARASRTSFTLNAFMHYTFHYSSGSLVVCGFEGSFEDGCYNLKSPVIHSVNESFGETDHGVMGIMKVFKNHRCNALCEDFWKPNIISEILPRNASSVSDSDESDYFLSDDNLSGYGSSTEWPRISERLIPTAPPPYEA